MRGLGSQEPVKVDSSRGLWGRNTELAVVRGLPSKTRHLQIRWGGPIPWCRGPSCGTLDVRRATGRISKLRPNGVAHEGRPHSCPIGTPAASIDRPRHATRDHEGQPSSPRPRDLHSSRARVDNPLGQNIQPPSSQSGSMRAPAVPVMLRTRSRPVDQSSAI